MEFKIEHTWNGFPVSHDPVTIRLAPANAGLLMDVTAPFYNDPPAPPSDPGKPFNGLWNYEVVESFFLNGQTEQYLEVELCPPLFSQRWIRWYKTMQSNDMKHQKCNRIRSHTNLYVISEVTLTKQSYAEAWALSRFVAFWQKKNIKNTLV